MWEWLRDHRKLLSGGGRSRLGSRDSLGLLRCEQPAELRGLVFLELEPSSFCTAPLIGKLGIQDVQPYSVLVSWPSRNHSSLRGFQVAFYALDNSDEVSPEPGITRSARLPMNYSLFIGFPITKGPRTLSTRCKSGEIHGVNSQRESVFLHGLIEFTRGKWCGIAPGAVHLAKTHIFFPPTLSRRGNCQLNNAPFFACTFFWET